MARVRKQKWVGLVWIGAGVMLALLLIHLLAVSLLRWQFESILHPQEGQGTYIGDVHLNLFSGLLAVQGVEVRDDKGIALQASELLVDVDLSALLQKRIHVQEIKLIGGLLRVDRNEDGDFHVLMPLASGEESAADEPPAFQLVSESVSIRRFNIDYRDALASGPELLRIESLDAKGPLQVDAPAVEFALEALWREARVDGKGSAQLGEQVAAQADLSIERFPVHGVFTAARMQPPAQATIDGGLKVSWADERATASGKMKLSGVQWKQDAMQLDAASLSGDEVDLSLSLRDAQPLQLQLSSLRAEGLRWRDASQDIASNALAFAQPKLDMELNDAAKLRLRGADIAAEAFNFNAGATRVQLAKLATQGDWQVDLGKQTFALKNLALKLQSLSIQQGSTQQGEQQISVGEANAQLQTAETAFMQPVLNGDLALSGIEAAVPQLRDDKVLVDAVSLAAWKLAGTNVSLGKLQVDALRLKQFPFSIAQVVLTKANLGEAAVALGDLSVKDLRGQVQRGADGVWQLPVASDQKTAASESSSKVDKGGAMAISVAGVRIVGDSRIRLIDKAVKPGIDRDIRIKRFKVGKLDSSKPTENTSLDLALLPDQYTTFELAGKLRPFASDTYLDFKGDLKGLELALLNGLIRDDLGHRFLAGQLDDDFSLSINKRELKMSNDLVLQDLDVSEIEGKSGPPLSTAIALLEDKNGRIELGVPVAGNLDNPDFKVLGALNPIIAKAVAGAAALAIQPLGSVALVGSLLASQAMAVKFDPALFEPKTAQIKDAGKLRKLAAKLKEKPKLKLRLCGLAVEADRTRDKKGNFVETEEQLLALAEQRAEQARKVMLDAGVNGQQLRSCRPAIEEKPDALPRVAIRL